MKKREAGDYLEDIIEAMNRAEEFIGNIAIEDFAKDQKTVFAVVRALEIIGEAVKNIPENVKTAYPQVPWRSMAGMRNKLIHEYFGVKLELIWKTAKKKIPPLKPIFQKILQDMEKGDVQ